MNFKVEKHQCAKISGAKIWKHLVFLLGEMKNIMAFFSKGLGISYLWSIHIVYQEDFAASQ